MKTARIAWAGAVHTAVPHPQGLQLPDGTVLAEADVVWLPPVEPGTIIALGLNYADHVKELSKELSSTSSEEPLAFLKTASSVIGHRGRTPRPAGVAFMHYECELAVVIGRTARRVKAADALAHVAGYTVANDYAVRDHLENWYRPNLRVKNRDGGTVLGPWLVSADEVPDPQALALRTRVNGVRHAAGPHVEHDPQRRGADRIPQRLHDAAARRHHPHRHARRRGQRQPGRRGRDGDRRHRHAGEHPGSDMTRIEHLINGRAVPGTQLLRDRQPGHAGRAGRGGSGRRSGGERRRRRGQGGLPGLGRRCRPPSARRSCAGSAS